jgi:hypothetical protein
MLDIDLKKECELIGWFKMTQTGMLKNVPFGVYCISAPENTMPDGKTWPHEYEKSLYFGIAGMAYDFFYDRKSKEHDKFWQTTVLQKRLNEHRSQLIRKDENMERETAYQKFYSKYGYGNDVIERVNVCVLAPKIKLENHEVRMWLNMVESSMIWCYNKSFKKAPLMQISHQVDSTQDRIDINSLNQKRKREIEENSLFRFVS